MVVGLAVKHGEKKTATGVNRMSFRSGRPGRGQHYFAG